MNEDLLINCPLLVPNRKSRDEVIDSKGRKLLKLFDDIGGVIVNGRIMSDSEGENTFCGVMGSSMIDYCVCSLEVLELLRHFQISHKPFSDHFPLIFHFSSENDDVKDMSLLPKIPWLPNKETAYKDALEKLPSVDYLFKNISIDDKVSICTGKITQAAGFKNLVKRFEPKNPWFDSQCENLRKKMLSKLDVFRSSNSEYDRITYIQVKSEYSKLCDAKKLNLCINNIEKLNSVRNTSDWWKLANSLKKSAPKLESNLHIEQLYDHFKSLLNIPDDVVQTLWCVSNVVDPFLDSPFELRELKIVLNHAKLNKAPGEDRISYEFYKFSTSDFQEELLKIYNFIFLNEDIPLSFKSSIIIPLFKKGDVNVASNYRGLSLLNSIYKIFTGLILNRLNSWVDCHNILNEYQAGFRRGYSTIDHLFTLSSIVHMNFSASSKTYAFFVDFSAAFDMIPRNSLFYKLCSLGLSRKIISLLQKLYENTTSKVWDGNKLSDTFEVTQGVKQGCLLSPLLFSLYLNDLHNFLPGGLTISNSTVKVLMYADDIVLLADSPAVLQLMIDSLHKYCLQWCLKLNLNKSKIVVFRKGGRLRSDLCWKYGNNVIEIVNEYKYLGVILTFNMSFKKHLESRLEMAKNSINATWLGCIHNQKINFSNKLKIFAAASQSILMYGAEIWGFKTYEQVNKLLRYFLKKMLYLPNNTPNYMLHLETGFSSLFLTSLRLHFGYINKVLNLQNNRLPKIMAEVSIQLKNFWFLEWEDLYRSSGLSLTTESWRIDLQTHHKLIINNKQVKENEVFTQSARNSQLHDLYSELQYDVVPYFKDGISPYMFSVIFKARGGLLNLNTHILNLDSPKECTLCNCHVIEDTYHFIGYCPIFKSYRLMYFGSTQLSTAEVIAILNGQNYFNLYYYLKCSLQYRNLLISEFSC